jgi:hypothetical protein
VKIGSSRDGIIINYKVGPGLFWLRRNQSIPSTISDEALQEWNTNPQINPHLGAPRIRYE